MKLGASFSISYYLCVFLSCLVSYSSVAGRDTISTDTAASGELQAADCDRSLIDFSKVPTNECFSNLCGSKIMDGLFSLEEIERLHTIVRKGMAQRVSVGGPTILDINTGYIRDSKGLENLFLRESDIYSSEDFSHYGSIIKKLKDTVANTFGISQLYFTAPTFITRLNGDIKWSPQGLWQLASVLDS